MLRNVAADRDTFGPRLKFERECRGVALKDIAAATKIKESLFVGLERNDFSNWPQGIFRRAHLCAYVSAIGLPPQPVLAEYLRLFPEDRPVDQSDNVEVHHPTGGHRSEETARPTHLRPRLEDRIWVVWFDLSAVCLISSILAGIGGIALWPAMALVGLGYSATGNACFAQSIGTYVQQWINALVRTRRPIQTTTKTPPKEVQPIASTRTRNGASQGDMSRERDVESRRASA
jgi:hypothetical protein